MKNSKWEIRGLFDDFAGCPRCGVYTIPLSTAMASPFPYRFCPFCGYKMDGELTENEKLRRNRAERVLKDNGIEADEVDTVLQAIGYVLLDDELYPENE